MKVLYEKGQRVPIKIWDGDGAVPFEASVFEQVSNVARLPFIHHHVAVMPDAHVGKGSTIGTVIATKGAIVPAAVGVDLGCGMSAQKTILDANRLPGDLSVLRAEIEKRIPHGRTDNGGTNDRGAWSENPARMMEYFSDELSEDFSAIQDATPWFSRWTPAKAIRQLGTLGTGNHFVEVCLDQQFNVWIVLHSGSRGIGNAIGTYFIEQAKIEAKRWFIELPDSDLAYLPEGSPLFQNYVDAVFWAQRYAEMNRELMMDGALDALACLTGYPPSSIRAPQQAVNCHHNYVAREHHFGHNVLVTRKGAVRARVGDLGIIPGSMGAKTFIVAGKGNPESFQSCSHGAGRVMSRTAAKRAFTVEDLAEQTAGIECRKDADVIDEAPKAYKDVVAVIAAQSDLIEVVAELRQVACVKG